MRSVSNSTFAADAAASTFAYSLLNASCLQQLQQQQYSLLSTYPTNQQNPKKSAQKAQKSQKNDNSNRDGFEPKVGKRSQNRNSEASPSLQTAASQSKVKSNVDYRRQEELALTVAIQQKKNLLNGSSTGLSISESLRLFLMRELRQTVPVVKEMLPEHKFLLFGEIPLDMDYFINKMKIRKLDTSKQGQSTSIVDRFRSIRRCFDYDNRVEFDLDCSHRGLTNFQYIIDALRSMHNDVAHKFATDLQSYQSMVQQIIQFNKQSTQYQQLSLQQQQFTNDDSTLRLQRSLEHANEILNSLNPDKEAFIYNIISKEVDGLITIKKGFSKGLIRSLGVSDAEFMHAVQNNKVFNNLLENVNQMSIKLAQTKMKENPYINLRGHEIRRRIHPDISTQISQQFQTILRNLVKEAITKPDILTDFLAEITPQQTTDTTASIPSASSHIPNPLPTFAQYQRFIKNINLHSQKYEFPPHKQIELFQRVTQVLTKKDSSVTNSLMQIEDDSQQEKSPSLYQPTINDPPAYSAQELKHHSLLFAYQESQQILECPSIPIIEDQNQALQPIIAYESSSGDVASEVSEYMTKLPPDTQQDQRMPSGSENQEYISSSSSSFGLNQLPSLIKFELNEQINSQSKDGKIRDYYEQLLQYIGNDEGEEESKQGLFPFKHHNSNFKRDIIKEYDQIRNLLEDGVFLSHEEFTEMVEDIKKQPRIKKKMYLRYLMKIPNCEDYDKKKQLKRLEKDKLKLLRQKQATQDSAVTPITRPVQQTPQQFSPLTNNQSTMQSPFFPSNSSPTFAYDNIHFEQHVEQSSSEEQHIKNQHSGKCRQSEVLKKVYELNGNNTTKSEANSVPQWMPSDYLEVFYISKSKIWKDFSKDFILNNSQAEIEQQAQDIISNNEFLRKYYPNALKKQVNEKIEEKPADQKMQPEELQSQQSSQEQKHDTNRKQQQVDNNDSIHDSKQEDEVNKDLLDKIIKQFKMGPPHPFKVLLSLKKSLQKLFQLLPIHQISQPFLKNLLKMIVFYQQGDTENYIKCRQRMPQETLEKIDKKIIKKLSQVPLI